MGKRLVTFAGGALPGERPFVVDVVSLFPETFAAVAQAGGWAIADFASAYAIGTSSMYFNNYYTDLQGGAVEEISAKYNMEDVITATLNFDVAYRPYGGIYMDTLQILASTDCGATFTEIFYAGGNEYRRRT